MIKIKITIKNDFIRYKNLFGNKNSKKTNKIKITI